MRSFLLEYTKRKDEGMDVFTDLHVNLWCVNSRGSEDVPNMYLDFGFMIDDISNVNDIILYCPFPIEKVEDLGHLLLNKVDLIEAIFNENCEVLSKIHPNRIKVTKKGDKLKPFKTSTLVTCGLFKNNDKSKSNEFIIYQLSDSLIKYTEQEEYTRIAINVSGILSGNEIKLEYLRDIKRYYFRIRITPKDGMINIVKRENEKINLFQDPSLRTTEIIDFRINDFRSISEEIKEEAFRLNTFDMSSVHYLVMRDATDEFVSGTNEYKSRILEKEVWKDYIFLENNDVIAYHFKKMNCSSFSNLSRFKYLLNVKKRVFCYISILLFLSVVSNAIYEFLIKKLLLGG